MFDLVVEPSEGEVGEPAASRLSPSSRSIGKNSQDWLRASQAPAPWRPRDWSAAKAIARPAMSGSRPIWFGWAWWRLCLEIHQP